MTSSSKTATLAKSKGQHTQHQTTGAKEIVWATRTASTKKTAPIIMAATTSTPIALKETEET